MNHLNFNVGIFGHVDSGKTSLAKALSTTSSTAAFDKNPQSQERGITLDLGFSSFVLPVTEHMKNRDSNFGSYSKLQITLVDCPGHASLFRTVIGGSQIIDLVFLVIDSSKGIQTQTAECLLLAEITCPKKMIVIVNKCDLLSGDVKKAKEKLEKRLRLALKPTSFAEAPMVFMAACSTGEATGDATNVNELLDTLSSNVFVPERKATGPFLFSVDHCFPIKGQGTVLTGTVLSGSAKVGDTVEIASLKEMKKIRSIQVFRKPVESVREGDRCGICVTQFEATQFERGLVCQPSALPMIYGALVSFSKIPYFKGKIATKSKFHISIGHETVLAACTFFQTVQSFGKGDLFNGEFAFLDEINENIDKEKDIFVLLEFDHAVLCACHSVYIASRLDADIHSNTCRLAFHGILTHPLLEKDYKSKTLPRLRIFKMKEKQGLVERLADEQTLISHSLFKKETSTDLFAGLKVTLSTGECGVIEGSFGQSGKVKVRFMEGFKPDTLEVLQNLGGKKKGKNASQQDKPIVAPIKLSLKFKRYIYDPAKKLIQ